LVEGERIMVRSRDYPEKEFALNFIETLVVPASLGKYSVLNLGSEPCKVTKALPNKD